MPGFLARLFRRSRSAPDSDRHYFRSATEYYAAARWAAGTIMSPVAGNLFHHAIELYLKGDLLRSMSGQELKDKYGHNLLRLWKDYKHKHATADLSRFDKCIKNVHKFEDIRYPDLIVQNGAVFMIPFRPHSGQIASVMGVRETPPTYYVAVNDVDELISAIFTASSINPDFYFKRLNEDATAVLYRDNPAFQPP